MTRLPFAFISATLVVSALAVTKLGAQPAYPSPTGQMPPAQPASPQPIEPPAVPHQPAMPPPQPPGVETRPERPYYGIFAGGTGAPQPQGLSLLFDGYGGWDTNVLASQQGGTNRPFSNVRGQYLGGSGAANYLWIRRQSLFAVTGSADVRKYPTLDVLLHQSYAGSMNGQFGIGRKLAVDVRQDAYRSSFYQLDFGPRAAVAPSDQPATQPSTVDQALSGSATYGFVSAANVTQTLDSRSTLEYGYLRRQTQYEADGHRFLMNRGEVGYRRGLTRYATLRLGYGYQKADYGGTGLPVTLQNIDVGVDYGRPLSFSRRTRVAFSAGSSMLSREAINFYRFAGTADIVHEIGRTWELAASYVRGMQLTDVIGEPLYTDLVGAHASGMAGRRMQLNFSSAYSTGQLTLSARSRGLRTYGGSAEMLYAFGQKLALYGAYSYYRYAINTGVVLTAGVPREADRNSVRGGVRLWVPVLIHRDRGVSNGLR